MSLIKAYLMSSSEIDLILMKIKEIRFYLRNYTRVGFFWLGLEQSPITPENSGWVSPTLRIYKLRLDSRLSGSRLRRGIYTHCQLPVLLSYFQELPYKFVEQTRRLTAGRQLCRRLYAGSQLGALLRYFQELPYKIVKQACRLREKALHGSDQGLFPKNYCVKSQKR